MGLGPFDSDGSGQLNDKKTIGYIALNLKEGQGTLSPDAAQSLIDDAKPLTEAGLDVGAGGYLGSEVSKPSTRVFEIVGIGAAIVVLLFTFGSVVFAGGTVIIALVALAAAGIPLVTALGYTSAIVVLLAVLSALTVLAAVLGLLGPRINRLALPRKVRSDDGRPRGWMRWAVLVASTPGQHWSAASRFCCFSPPPC
ncbi:MAG: MMPL family transporter [Ornithinimicrobium sp.]